MSDTAELTCVSCEAAFDPAPTGGFCPDCDTPHPDFDHGEADQDDDATDAAGEADGTEAGPAGDDPETATADDADEPAAETGDDEEAAEDDAAGPAYCPECGAEIAADAESADATAHCTDCGAALPADAAYCPACGSAVESGERAEQDDGQARGGTTPEPSQADAEPDAPDADASEPVPDEITLVVNGESYVFEDGDTFGRRDEEWLEDLVVAGGGADELSYISSEHVEFSIEDDGVYVTDVSRNGTLLNSTEMDGGTERVRDGDFLTLAGRAEVEVRL